MEIIKFSGEDLDLNAFDISMLKRAFEESENSVAQKRKVGAIIVSMGIGAALIIAKDHNRMFENLKDRYDGCENADGESYECVIHAEEGAITQFLYNKSADLDKTIYVTYSPCMNCCKLIASAGIKRVVYCEEHKKNFVTAEVNNGFSPKQFLFEMGIEVVRYAHEIVFPEKHVPEFKTGDNAETALIYHGADVDGLMSGYLLSRDYAQQIEKGRAVLIPYNYEKEADWMKNENFYEFIFVDVTPPIEWLKKRFESDRYFSIHIYDHHEPKYLEIMSHFKENFKLGNDYYFYPDICGCKIYSALSIELFGDKNKNLRFLIDLISDYDTWKFANEDYVGPDTIIEGELIKVSKNTVLYFQYALQQAHNLEQFKEKIEDILSHNCFVEGISKYLNQGKIIIDGIKQNVEKIIKHGLVVDFTFVYQGYPDYFLGEQLLIKYPELKYWVGFQIDLDKNIIKFSVRSKSENNCHTIAKQYGGGGHSKAAGFAVTLEEGFKIIDNYRKTFESSNKINQ